NGCQWLCKDGMCAGPLPSEPRLANYTERPAVHWFSFADLCAVGRLAGFAQFYSLLDLRTRAERRSSGNPRKRGLRGGWPLGVVQRSPLLRSIALTQIGGEIVMLKRGACRSAAPRRPPHATPSRGALAARLQLRGSNGRGSAYVSSLHRSTF